MDGSSSPALEVEETETATATPTLTATATEVPAETPTATQVPTETPTETATPTAAPTATPAPNESPTPAEELPSGTAVPKDSAIDMLKRLAKPGLKNIRTLAVLRLGYTPEVHGTSYQSFVYSVAWFQAVSRGELSASQSTTVGAPAALPTSTTTTITYQYDALNRVTEANYDNRNYYYYEYDEVGNRKKETTPGSVTNYIYDDANRLASVNGVSYTNDANGNLVDDGIRTYTNDYADRLVSLTQGEVTYSYTYNGRGDRLQQAENGVTTSYVLDLAAHLTQVLSDGESSYLNGLGRIGESSDIGGWRYHLADALGSVRQLADLTGEVVFAQSYEPYGDVLHSFGEVGSHYGFTGEMQDASGLVYLRARYYNSGIGRFLTRDTWAGDYNDPQSLNRWAYVQGNPINHTDPTGMCIDGVTTIACLLLLLKVIDYAWTSWDIAQSTIIINDDNACIEEKILASLNIGVAVIFEALEPDDPLPVGLPVDDVARKAFLKGVKEAFEGGGQEGLEKFLRSEFGDEVAEEILERMWDTIATGDRHHVFTTKIMREIKTNPNLAGIIDRDDLLIQAITKEAHNGYEGWHINYDEEVIEWLAKNWNASKSDFVEFLIEIYSRDEMKEKFPQAIIKLKKYLELGQ